MNTIFLRKPAPKSHVLRPPLFLALSCTVLLVACGGSGGNGSDSDQVPPTISSIAPTGGETSVRTRVTVTGSASDDRQLASVAVEANGSRSVATLIADRFSADIDLRPGLNTYTVVATDAAGNVARSEGSVYLGKRVAAGGSHSGALVGGAFYAWGRNNFGQIGTGTATTLAANPDTHPISPVKITTPAPFVSLSFNQNQSIALDQNGHLWSWGDDSNGQLGRGDAGRASCGSSANNCRLDIGQVGELDGVLTVSTGYGHVLALRNDGTVWAFGLNSNGQLGDGTSTSRSTPVQVQWAPADAATVGRIVQVSASSASSYALDDKGQVWGWGRDQYANLGRGSATTSATVQATPVRVPLPDGVKIVEIANGRDHVLARTQNGRVYAWGLNASSQVGYNGVNYKGTANAWASPVLSPTLLPSSTDAPALAVYANGNTSYALRSGGKIYPWGMYGATEGSGSTIYANLDEPEDRLPMLSDIQDLAVGALHQVALRKDGKLFSWGWSFEGSLGGGGTMTNAWMYNVPVTLALL